MATASDPLGRERKLILATLLILSAAGWALLIWWPTAEMGQGMPAGLTMGMGGVLFLAMWVAMMVAMMFPTAAPMILLFARVHADKRQRGQAFVPTWVFVGAYLLVWGLAGVLAYAGATLAERVAAHSSWAMAHAGQIGGVLLILAGLYQISSLKHACLSRCRTPMHFIVTSWRDGHWGSFRMGIAHGIACLGCCWLLFLILFPLGIMNVPAMAAIALLIFAEKTLPQGERVGRLAAVALVAYGLLVFLIPGALPTTM